MVIFLLEITLSWDNLFYKKFRTVLTLNLLIDTLKFNLDYDKVNKNY